VAITDFLSLVYSSAFPLDQSYDNGRKQVLLIGWFVKKIYLRREMLYNRVTLGLVQLHCHISVWLNNEVLQSQGCGKQCQSRK